MGPLYCAAGVAGSMSNAFMTTIANKPKVIRRNILFLSTIELKNIGPYGTIAVGDLPN